MCGVCRVGDLVEDPELKEAREEREDGPHRARDYDCGAARICDDERKGSEQRQRELDAPREVQHVVREAQEEHEADGGEGCVVVYKPRVRDDLIRCIKQVPVVLRYVQSRRQAACRCLRPRGLRRGTRGLWSSSRGVCSRPSSAHLALHLALHAAGDVREHPVGVIVVQLLEEDHADQKHNSDGQAQGLGDLPFNQGRGRGAES